MARCHYERCSHRTYINRGDTGSIDRFDTLDGSHCSPVTPADLARTYYRGRDGDHSRLDVARAVRIAEANGWIPLDFDREAFRTLNRLVAWILSDGSIDERHLPTFVAATRIDRHRLVGLFDDLGIDYRVVQDERTGATRYRPAVRTLRCSAGCSPYSAFPRGRRPAARSRFPATSTVPPARPARVRRDLPPKPGTRGRRYRSASGGIDRIPLRTRGAHRSRERRAGHRLRRGGRRLRGRDTVATRLTVTTVCGRWIVFEPDRNRSCPKEARIK
ncbi:hypothetical protein [Halalkalicoccus salilacus]|uniref:hypothetical protein n=1 Tax=Halalkalicoccus sp. GCM10025704 TaxID=3252662 RepID=UPI00360BC21C